MIKLGISTLFLVSKRFKFVEEMIEKSNVKYWEIVDEGDIKLNERRVKRLKELKSSLKLEYSVHAPFADMNIASLNPIIRRVVIKRLEKSLQSTYALDSKIWILHPGSHSGLSTAYPGKDFEISIESIEHFAKTADDLGLTIAVENMPEQFQALFVRASEFEELFSRISHENVKISFDVGHANTVNQVNEFMEKFLDKFAHVHVHDNDGRSDSHLPVGKGTIDWEPLLDKLIERKFEGIVSIETFKDPITDLKTIQELLRVRERS